MISDLYQTRLKEKKSKEYRGLRYKKLIAEIVKKTVESGNPKLTNNDIKEISLKIYKSNDKIKCSRVKSMMTQEIVKNDVNNELQRILTDAGFPKDKLKELYTNAEKYANDKKDGNLLLKIAEKIERANNLTQGSSITARTIETTDFSKIGKDGNPAQKVVKVLEITKNEAIRDDIGNDQGGVDGKPSQERDLKK